MLIGLSSSSYHIEGGNTTSDWYDFEQKYYAEEAQRCGVSIDYWNKWSDHHQHLSDLGIHIWRNSIEWSRVEPQKGVFDESAIKHYHQILLDLKNRNIKTVVTFFHFVLPKWFSDIGGFEKKENLVYFEKFVSKCLTEFSDSIDYITPVNETMSYIMSSYVTGYFPAGQKSIVKSLLCARNLIRAHFIVAEIIAEKKYDIMLGTAEHIRFVSLESRVKPLVKLFDLVSSYFNCLPTKCIVSNRFHFPLGFGLLPISNKFKDVDFLGIQLYHTVNLKLSFTKFPFMLPVKDVSWVDLLYDGKLDSEDFSKVLNLFKVYNKPVMFTELGLHTTSDEERTNFLNDTVSVLKSFKDIEILGFLYFTLFDVFEWLSGHTKKFGLMTVEDSLITKKNSYYTLKNIIKGKR
jgi:beta-glucosidase